MKLTPQQGKMALEYLATQAAVTMPDSAALIQTWDKHLWMTRFQTSLAIERQITEHDWDELVTALQATQSFDRDSDGYLHQNGYPVNSIERSYVEGNLEDEVSFAIDNCWNNSGS